MEELLISPCICFKLRGSANALFVISSWGNELRRMCRAAVYLSYLELSLEQECPPNREEQVFGFHSLVKLKSSRRSYSYMVFNYRLIGIFQLCIGLSGFLIASVCLLKIFIPQFILLWFFLMIAFIIYMSVVFYIIKRLWSLDNVLQVSPSAIKNLYKRRWISIILHDR